MLLYEILQLFSLSYFFVFEKKGNGSRLEHERRILLERRQTKLRRIWKIVECRSNKRLIISHDFTICNTKQTLIQITFELLRFVVTARAKKRGLPQLGTLGAGNHYCEGSALLIFFA